MKKIIITIMMVFTIIIMSRTDVIAAQAEHRKGNTTYTVEEGYVAITITNENRNTIGNDLLRIVNEEHYYTFRVYCQRKEMSSINHNIYNVLYNTRMYDCDSWYLGSLGCRVRSTTNGYIFVEVKTWMTRDETFATERRAFEILGKMNRSSDYAIVKAVHDYLVLNCSFDFSTSEGNNANYSAYSCLIEQNSVCLGYAQSFQLMMSLLRIPCKIIRNDTHSWNIVQIDGKWYHIDCTWDDPDDGTISYQYFLVGTDVMGSNYQNVVNENLSGITIADKSYLLYGMCFFTAPFTKSGRLS